MSQQDDIKAFNTYCADVMGYKIFPDLATSAIYHAGAIYEPHTNLNQLAEVFDKLLANEQIPKAFTVFSGEGIATAMREFIESTHD